MAKEWNAIPPPPKALEVATAAEMLALCTIVIVLIADMALRYERSGDGNSQSWINKVAELCAEVIDTVEVPGVRDLPRFRREALDHINNTLAAVRMNKKGRDKAN